MKFKSWKWNKLNRKLRILVPFTFFTAAIGGAAGYLLSPTGNQIFITNSSLEAGYDQNFRVPIFENQYKDWDLQTGNLQVIQKPNVKTAQSFELKTTDLTTETFNDNAVFNVAQAASTGVRRPNESNYVSLYKASFTREQFEQAFKNRRDPDLGFLFKTKFEMFDPVTKQNKVVSYDKGLITGFSLKDLELVKSKTYQIFHYSVNDDFSDLQGTVSASMEMRIDKRGRFFVEINLGAHNLTTQNLSTIPTENQFKVSFEKVEGNQIFKPLIFWNLNSTNDLDRWYWPNPRGPVQNPEVVAPLFQDSAVISDKDYTVTLTDNAQKKYVYELVDNFESKINDNTVVSKTQTGDELLTARFENQKWQTNFFNSWDKKGVAKDPGSQVKFDLNFDVRDGEYGQVQKYKTSVYGYFNFSSLINGNSVDQTIVSYDLSDGRVKNFGKLLVKLNARVNLRGQLVIKVSSIAKDFAYSSSEFASDIDKNDFHSSLKIDNLEISRYYDGAASTNAVNKDEIGPIRNFNRDVRQLNIKVVNSNIAGATQDSNKNGHQVRSRWNFWDPYLFHYHRIWSTEQTEDFSNYVENEKEFAEKTQITFRFAGLTETNNRTNIVLNSPGSSKILNKGLKGWTADGKDAGSGESIYGPNDLTDPYTSFTIPFSEIGKKANNDQFWFKRLYAFQNQNYGSNGFDQSLFNFTNTRSNANYSAMRVIYYLQLTKVGDFGFKYRIGMDVSSYQWDQSNTSASRGKSGITLQNIEYQIGK
ncbi:hypothetical protein J2Z62_000495 [Mycoplasmoides fastidiosum]|uniref:DUF31 domain-containing protein n=1 Tax=Mycoplasmoides fastidiosum TaxID=92758 RepID=A0ABU0LZC7_9BACT|nr:hypothetical protein [Mycoplasmoides fastidiosum]MDQ0514057.1 hypothetical protein [Mycoplasmoides fastidiosum]UUD37532.1 hypothetical protein NPA10_03115 [Mycoplasmoides fastidiosum]